MMGMVWGMRHVTVCGRQDEHYNIRYVQSLGLVPLVKIPKATHSTCRNHRVSFCRCGYRHPNVSCVVVFPVFTAGEITMNGGVLITDLGLVASQIVLSPHGWILF